MLETVAAAPILAEMAHDAAMKRLLATQEVSPANAAALCEEADRIDSWRAYMRRLAVALDEIAEDAAEDARIAEEDSSRRKGLPAGVACVAPSAAQGSESGQSLRKIGQVLALAERDRGSVVQFPRGLRIVPAADGGAAA